jgi:peptide/nickel transport system ATP-binding protein
MYLGKVVEQTDIQTLFRDPKHPYTQALLRSIPRLGQKSRSRLNTIEGMVPTPSEMPAGCSFHPRCPMAIPSICNVRPPSLIEVSDGHKVRCVLYDN